MGGVELQSLGEVEVYWMLGINFVFLKVSTLLHIVIILTYRWKQKGLHSEGLQAGRAQIAGRLWK